MVFVANSQSFTGFVAGGNMALLTGDSTNMNMKSPRFGFYTGVMWDIPMDLSTYIQVGVYYSQQGAVYKSEYYYQGLFYRDSKIFHVNYLHVPVVWKQRWDWIYTELGGYVGIVPGTAKALWRQEIYYADDVDTLQGYYPSFARNIVFYDIGAVLGLGMQFKLNEDFDIFFNLRFKPGLIKLYKGYVPYPEFASKNMVFTLSTGIIHIGKAARHRKYIRKLKRR